ncbi:MucR family transcriptional regulator [Geobacter pelophilus]|jgi:predicted transcriptional regulator|uniref:MucR family transcriptional regulator n=1 Tax=Geoanaerobacter pelophilus TaxID=60036 RepID=A0AAW4L1L1_9BACT|nr:MucR family transcriptional regulator [Geoanaerobacter pelophilus]MBT0664604.1 MucR family transcriptional regulator [Geoanaerobacter pelophilus]
MASTIIEMAAEIVAAHASTTTMSSEELIAELQKVHAALQSLEAGKEVVVPGEEVKPAITVKEAFKKNEVICLVCGKGGFKTLTRHLNSAHNIKPKDYKKQFGIPSKQPLSAKSLTDARRKVAQDRGLASNLAKARQVRAANAAAKNAKPAKAAPKAKVAKPKK